ncbi:MAG: hypothetical protein NT004_07835 [Bacteroidetes bacterium]|nr:hypothetical protein [Bacteroidota bacterium]
MIEQKERIIQSSDLFVNLEKKEMIVERQNNEILVRFSAGIKTSRIQTILDYLRYEELTSKSTATEDNIDQLLGEVKKGRWNRTKKELGLND